MVEIPGADSVVMSSVVIIAQSRATLLYWRPSHRLAAAT